MTESDYTARKKRMAALLSEEDRARSISPHKAQLTTQEPITDPTEQISALAKKSVKTAQGSHTTQVPLEDIEIDLHQPRQFFPADLRHALASGKVSHNDVLAQLLERATGGDMEAQAYVEDIRGLADDIKAHGLLSAVLVYTSQTSDGRTRYQLIDGERRFWAYVYLSAQQDSDMTHIRAEVNNEFEHASADDIISLQWSANMQRESVCAMDLAEFVYQKREEAVRTIQTDSKLLTQWSDNGKPISPRDTAQRIVCHHLAHTFGRPLKRRAYYQYLSLAEKLSASVKALARAHKLPLGRLIQITSQPKREQIAAVLRIIESQHAPEDVPAKPNAQPKRPGRPTRSQGRITLAERAVAGMVSDTEPALMKWGRDELTAVLQKDQDLLEATDRHLRLVQAVLSHL